MKKIFTFALLTTISCALNANNTSLFNAISISKNWSEYKRTHSELLPGYTIEVLESPHCITIFCKKITGTTLSLWHNVSYKENWFNCREHCKQQSMSDDQQQALAGFLEEFKQFKSSKNTQQ